MENQKRTTQDLLDKAKEITSALNGYAVWEAQYIIKNVEQLIPLNSVIHHSDNCPYVQSDQSHNQKVR